MDISFQLYSARNFAPWDDVLGMISRLGYTRVEGFGGVYADAPAFRAMLDRHGLTMPSGHFFPLGCLEEGLDASLAVARALGMGKLYCPAPEDLWRDGTDAANWIALARRLEEAGRKINDAGFRFGWHNHHWEFAPLPDGSLGMDLILEHAPSIDWEIDIAWVAVGGADPIAWIEAHRDRINAAHVKDVAPAGENADEDGWADVGHGTLDWPAITQTLRGIGVDLFVMEHDAPSDVARFAQRSITSFKTY